MTPASVLSTSPSSGLSLSLSIYLSIYLSLSLFFSLSLSLPLPSSLSLSIPLSLSRQGWYDDIGAYTHGISSPLQWHHTMDYTDPYFGSSGYQPCRPVRSGQFPLPAFPCHHHLLLYQSNMAHVRQSKPEYGTCKTVNARFWPWL